MSLPTPRGLWRTGQDGESWFAKLSVVCPNDLYRKVKGEGAVPVLLNTKIALP